MVQQPAGAQAHRTGVVLVAAGAGTRLGAPVPKALVRLADQPLVCHAVSRLCATGMIESIVVTAPPGYGDEIGRAARAAIPAAADERPALEVIEGDFPSRQASVAAGLDRLDPGVTIALVHDAARPLTPSWLITGLIRAVQDGHPAVVPAVVVPDTIRMVHEDDPARAQGVLDRDRLRAIQTPQAFDARVLRRAHASGAARGRHEYSAATDDAALVEALAIDVHVLPGDRAAMKITDAHDLAVAQILLSADR